MESSSRADRGHRPPNLFYSLCLSMGSILLSLVMLVGTTMAWFTDSASSGSYTITAGNLSAGKSVLYDADNNGSRQAADSIEWKALPTQDETDNALFAGTYLPGDVKTVYLRLHNEGTLPTRYRISLQLLSDTNEVSKKLIYGCKILHTQQERQDFMALSAEEKAKQSNYDTTDSLDLHSEKNYSAQSTTCVVELPNDTETQFAALSIFRPAGDTVTAAAEGEAPSVQVRLTVIASQYDPSTTSAVPLAWDGTTATAADAFEMQTGEDESGYYPINTPEDLAGVGALLQKLEETHTAECTLRLMNDIDLNDQPWTPIDTTVAVTLNGDGHTIYNLNAASAGEAPLEYAGLFGRIDNLTVNSLHFAGGKAAGSAAAGMLAGAAGSANLTAVYAENITVYGPAATSDALVGQTVTALTRTDCTATNYSVQAAE